MRMRFHSLVVAIGLSAVSFSGSASGSARATASAKERTEGLIAAFKKVKTEAKTLPKTEKASNEKAFAELDDFFDYPTLTSKPIEPLAGKLTAEELAQFKAKFRELIRLVAFPNAGEAFRKAKLSLLPETKRGERVAVPVKVRMEEDDLDLTIEFEWASTPAGLRVHDVLLDGDSLLKDYQNQVSKVVAKSGVPGLFKALDARRAELEKS